ncbi:MAG: 2Fe-2S iron-sulfur cluster binding domain-containing protein [Lacunisphaera sp.]|nr:2Fe-2S iron-sulfur cluster binding domain-containing protein [Lacunisphaera sp.]
MIQPLPSDLITVNVDGQDIAVPKGTNMIEAARLARVEVPHYCYHPKLTISGNCRMCLVEMGLPAVDPATKAPLMDPATGKPKINWMPRPTIACATNASPGLHIRTNTAAVQDCRNSVTEFLLINHPLDCPICDQAGECKLQEHSTAYGRGYSRFVEQKNVKPKRTQLGPRVTLDDERCILCSRCVRFSKEIAQDDVLGFIDRGSYSTLTCYPGKQLAHNYSLNTVDLCPVGALTSTDFRFKMRVWFLKQTPSLDCESSVGANTEVWSREGVIYRITPRQNDAVNDTWMADSGRVLFKEVSVADRLSCATLTGIQVTQGKALQAAVDLLSGRGGRAESGAVKGVAVVSSGRSTVEEQFLTQKIAAKLNATVALVSRVGVGDKILVSADRNPNIRGALVTGLIRALPEQKLTALGAAIDAGQVQVVLSIGEDLIAAGLTEAQQAKLAVIYLGTHQNATSAVASVVIPTLTVFEKAGTLVNQQFRLQKFARAVPGLAGVSDDLVTLSHLLNALGGAPLGSTLGALWPVIAAEVKVLAHATFDTLPSTGLLLDSTSWAGLPFVEGETLHFKPVAVTGVTS